MYSVHTHPFNGPFSWTTWVSQYQKGKTDLDFLKQETVSDSGISCAVCKSAPCSRQITAPAPHHCFYRRDALPTNSTEGNVRHTIQNDKSCCKTAHIFGRDAIESRRSRESYLTNFTNWFAMPSVLRHCWLGVRKSIRPVKIQWWGVDMVQLMPRLLKTASSLVSFKSRLVLPCWYRLSQVVLEKRPLYGCSVV